MCARACARARARACVRGPTERRRRPGHPFCCSEEESETAYMEREREREHLLLGTEERDALSVDRLPLGIPGAAELDSSDGCRA